jgi:hypothetical protein
MCCAASSCRCSSGTRDAGSPEGRFSVFLVNHGGMDLLEMANTRRKRPSPDVRPQVAPAQNGAPAPVGVNFLTGGKLLPSRLAHLASSAPRTARQRLRWFTVSPSPGRVHLWLTPRRRCSASALPIRSRLRKSTAGPPLPREVATTRSLSEKYDSRRHVVMPEHFNHKMLWTHWAIFE